MANESKISVIVPCYNEEKFIEPLIKNLVSQDYPTHLTEIIFADGNSSDKTRAIIEDHMMKYPNIKCIENPGQFVPSGLNLAIKAASGDVIIRVDAHSIYPLNYFKVLIDKLFSSDAQNVGGMWDTQPGADTDEARAIVLATSHPLGIGNASYRLGGDRDVFVDTVPFGCFHRNLFERIGFFDEDLLRNQDDEFNGRIIKHGGKILLIPSLKIKYFARPTFSKLARMFYQYGLFKPLVNIKLGAPATLRQFAPPLLVLSIVVLILLSAVIDIFRYLLFFELFFYFCAIVFVSIKLTRMNSLKLLLNTALAFPAIHFSYGIGYIFGLYRYTFKRQHLKNGSIITSSR